jgi:hypothetical protein
MANEQNLRPGEYKLTQEQAKKGGKKSAAVRKEKKTIQTILNDYLNSSFKDNATLSKLAKTAGIENSKSIKELVTAICILNTLKRGDVNELQKLVALLGEDTANNGTIDKLDEVLKGIDGVMKDES